VSYLYEEDENLWLFENAKLLEEGKINEVDWKHIREELELMGKSQHREVESRFIVLLKHLLKWKYQKEKRTPSWKATIEEQRDELVTIFHESKNLSNYATDNQNRFYERARRYTSTETELPIGIFPENSPFTLEQVLNQNYLPE
jgi:AAA15 family ATPase/GTPase